MKYVLSLSEIMEAVGEYVVRRNGFYGLFESQTTLDFNVEGVLVSATVEIKNRTEGQK